MRLGRAVLDRLPAAVARPGYRPEERGVGIVHLGLGAFHRAHQAVYLDDCLARDGGDWRVLAATLRSPSTPAALRAQDGLYTLAVREDRDATCRIVGAIADAVFAPDEMGRLLDTLAAPTTSALTLTITEKGYGHVPATGALDATRPDIVHDLAHPDAPTTALGVIAAALRRRRSAGGPLTVVSCDNLPGNGALLRRVLLQFVERSDPSLARWAEANLAFPSTVVDRIVPATAPSRVDELEAQFGYRDELLVETEPFTQWIVEDRFAGPMPDLAGAGVRLVSDIGTFERVKLRMLNAAHSLLAYAGLMAGCTFVHQAVARDDLREAARRLMLDEAAPTLGLDRALDPAAYAESLLARFANGSVAHRLEQIACDGSQKLPLRILPTVSANLANDGPIGASALAVAGWIAVAGARARWSRFPNVTDPLDGRLLGLLSGDGDPVDAAMAQRTIFGDVGATPRFRDAVRTCHAQLVAS